MTSNDQHTIDEYLLNRLDATERQSFEQSLANDETLRKELEEHQQLIAAMGLIGDVQMKERVKRIHQAELGRGAKQPNQANLWKWVVAVIILSVASLGIWLMVRPKAQTPPQLYASYYKPYDLNFGSRNTDASQILAEAGNLYKAGKFAEALPLFEQTLSIAPSDSKARLAMGICQLELKQYDQALTQFSALIEAKDPLFGEQALWYSAMTKLQQGSTTEAKTLLVKMLTDYQTGVFYKDATQLLSDLSN
ncbi:MAG: tetratricopeptide repeat protein [Saprospiraceae bacterium]|nr:tetratricopeptide repeat protein [Saprospiraceae bacterium]